MFKPKLSISKELFEKIKQASELAMCTNPEEWATQVLEAEAAKVLQDAGKGDLSDEEVEKINQQLQGLGYLE